MFTPRAWLLLLVVFLMLAWAFFDHLFLPSRSASDAPNVSLLLFALGLALWFGWEWFHFLLGVRLAKRRIRLRRVLADERGPIDILWAHQPVNVQLEIVLDSVWPLPYVRLADRLPATAQFTEGQAVYEGRLDSASPVLLHYRLRSSGIGSIRFEGVHIKIADCQGLFYAATFVPDRTVYRVLPPLADIRGHAPSKKRHNLLPPPGVHRLLRPGSGSELLDLRDYLPGDPPKTIAWKASARRDRLMTKEFESEVPIRCTMFIDTSDSVRWGMPGRNLMTSLIEIAAGVSQAANGVRDLAGICLFDEESTTYLRPGRGPRHLSKIMNMLAEAADRQPLFPDASLVSVLIPSYQLACEVYPECLHPEVNDFPAWLAWLLPPSASTFRQPTQQDRLYQWMPVWLAIIGTTSVLLTAGLFAAILFVASHNTSDTMLFILFPLLFLTMLGVIKVPSLLFAEKTAALPLAQEVVGAFVRFAPPWSRRAWAPPRRRAALRTGSTEVPLSPPGALYSFPVG
ncbi:MAG: hypothetical protein KatS3mg105_3064 [Gemmatales bacterium]|nr:MAG: hypothetical protein KatS3mg105_3064 [Gemmatales bacterium]